MNAARLETRMQWGVRIPLRDGVCLNATLYLPKDQTLPRPAIFTLTPYIAQTYHDRGEYFAAHGYPFLTIDVRGRGNSEGTFRPLIGEAQDGYDIVEWLAKQPYCNGQVAMWGGSYGGYVQWATAGQHPPHLATIVPVAAPYAGADFPGRNHLPRPYLMQWLTLVWGRTAQDKLFWNNLLYWGARFREWLESGAALKDLDAQLGHASPVFQEWLAHPDVDDYWDSYNLTSQQYAGIGYPVLTITGIYDGDQPGALMHYRQHLNNAGPSAWSRHYLIIGPWDHAGTRTPAREFFGLKVGPASLVDLPKLHLQWYTWTMEGGPRPEFLQNNVAYYVMGAEKWRYAPTLEAITTRYDRLFLGSTRNPTDVFNSGSLSTEHAPASEPDHYIYDPRDTSLAELEATVDPQNQTDQRMVHASSGKLLIYHSAPFDADTEISGFFKLSVWLSIDRPDTDFRATIFEIGRDGSSIQLTSESLRARYRQSLRKPQLVETTTPLRYDFEGFSFTARRIAKGSRLRLVFGPINSIYSQKNYNSGGPVSAESMRDASPVLVRLLHDPSHPSVLHVPIAQSET